MRRLWLAGFLATACYQAPAFESSSCTLRCERTCPDGLRCEGGYCVAPGETCGGDLDAGAGVDASADATVAPATACIADVALGRRHTCAVKNDGTVWCTGDNSYSQLGSKVAVASSDPPVQVRDATGPIADAKEVAAGWAHTCAIRAGGTVSCWGANWYGQLGNGRNVSTPVAVQVLTAASTPLLDVASVDVGFEHSCARTATGAVWCWGLNVSGQLGDGTTGTRTYATQVSAGASPLSGAAELTVGPEYGCARMTGGEVLCWGSNAYGQLGTGTTNGVANPVPTTTLIGTPAELAAGRLHACSRSASSEVSCWGSDWHHRRGNPADPAVYSPTAVLMSDGTPLTGVTGLAMAGISCALMATQQVMCWGDNVHGQHGSGAGSTWPATVTLPSGQPLSNVVRITAGFAHVCAFRAGGEVLCWGRGESGELGGGRLVNVGHPTLLGIPCP